MVLIKFLSRARCFRYLSRRVSLQNIWTPVHRIIYMLNLWESPKSAGCDAGYELFLAVSLRRFYFTALPVACARVKLEWVKRGGKKREKDAAEPRARCDASVYRFIARFISLPCTPSPSWSPAFAPRSSRRGKNANWEPEAVSSARLGKKTRDSLSLPSALCRLPVFYWRPR